jgi:hypothetical protein
MTLVVGIPASILNLQQQGLIERSMYDALFPNMLFRSEAEVDTWPLHTGTEMLFTRTGLMTPRTKPLRPGTDPDPDFAPHEQWIARLSRYGSRVDTHMPTSVTANADLFLDNVKTLGLNAAQSTNRISRNSLYAPYLSGNTVATAAGVTGDTTLQVASLNGFTDVVTTGSDGSVRPVPVSTSTPLAITIVGVTGSRNVIGFTANNPDDLLGPGTLQLSASLGASVSARAPVVSSAAAVIYRVGGGSSIDAISSSDILQFQDMNAAASVLRRNNVLKHEDGMFHGHLPPEAMTQLGADDLIRRGQNANIESTYYKDAFIAELYKSAILENNECPDSSNAGALTSTGTAAFYAEDIGAEVINESGVRIGRMIITGRGCLQERWLDESSYVTEAGVGGKIGEFEVANNGISIETLRTKLIIASPINALLDQVRASWSTTTSFAAPSDKGTGGPARFKRAVVLEFALS